jgi:putative proteasome-type protease
VKLCLISMDSTIRSNLSVGFPLDLVVVRRDSQEPVQCHIGEDDPYFRHLSNSWSEALRSAYSSLPEPSWQGIRKIRVKK